MCPRGRSRCCAGVLPLSLRTTLFIAQCCARGPRCRCTRLTNGRPLVLHSLQIVAGLEPENTNVFLQMLGTAARMGNAVDAVQVRGVSQRPRGEEGAFPLETSFVSLPALGMPLPVPPISNRKASEQVHRLRD